MSTDLAVQRNQRQLVRLVLLLVVVIVVVVVVFLPEH